MIAMLFMIGRGLEKAEVMMSWISFRKTCLSHNLDHAIRVLFSMAPLIAWQVIEQLFDVEHFAGKPQYNMASELPVCMSLS